MIHIAPLVHIYKSEKYIFFFFLDFIYLFLREREREQGRGRERGRERISSRLHARSADPNVGLEPTNHEIMT